MNNIILNESNQKISLEKIRRFINELNSLISLYDATDLKQIENLFSLILKSIHDRKELSLQLQEYEMQENDDLIPDIQESDVENDTIEQDLEIQAWEATENLPPKKMSDRARESLEKISKVQKSRLHSDIAPINPAKLGTTNNISSLDKSKSIINVKKQKNQEFDLGKVLAQNPKIALISQILYYEVNSIPSNFIPVINDTILEELIPERDYCAAFVLDNITLSNYGLCKDCPKHECNSCITIKNNYSKNGVKADIEGFYHSGKEIKLVAFNRALAQFLRINYTDLIYLVKLDENKIVAAKILQLYQGHSFIYEWNKKVKEEENKKFTSSIVANKLIPISIDILMGKIGAKDKSA